MIVPFREHLKVTVNAHEGDMVRRKLGLICPRYTALILAVALYHQIVEKKIDTGLYVKDYFPLLKEGY